MSEEDDRRSVADAMRAINQAFREDDQMINVIDRTAVTTLTYEMVYARAGERYRATGRDVWVFQREDTRWIAVWRTMMDLSETPL